MKKLNLAQTDEMEETVKIKEKTDGCYVKQRYVLCFMAFLVLCHLLFMRAHVGVTILAMVNTYVSNNETQTLPNTTQAAQAGKLLEWSNIEQGNFLGAYFYGYSLGNFPGGMFTKVFGFRKIISISFFLSGLLEMFTPLAARQDFYLAFAIRFVMGFLHGPIVPASISIWSKWSPPLERSVLNSVTLSGGLFGTIIIIPLTGLIVKALSWEAIYYFTGGSTILCSILFLCVVTETPEENSRITEKEKRHIRNAIGTEEILSSNTNTLRSVPWKKILTSKCVFAHIVCHTADCWYQLALPSLLPGYMVFALNYNVLQSSMFMILPYTLQLVVAVVSGHVTDILRAKKVVTTTTIRKINSCTAVMTAGLLAAVSTYFEDGGAVMGIFSLGFAISGLSYPGYLSNALDIAPAYASVIFSISNTISCSIGGLAPIIAAIMVPDKSELSQWQSFFWLTCGITCVGGTTYAIFGSGVQQEWSKPKDEELEKNNRADATLMSPIE